MRGSSRPDIPFIPIVWLIICMAGLFSASARAFDFGAAYYGVYEAPGSGNTTIVYIVPKNSFLIIAADVSIPIMFMPQTTGFSAILAPDGTLGAFQKVNYNANTLPVGAIPSSYKLHSGDFDGNGTPDFLLQGTGARYSVVLTADATGTPQIYYSFGTALNTSVYPGIQIFDADANGRADIFATNTANVVTAYYSSGYGAWFDTMSPGPPPATPNTNLNGAISGDFRVTEQGEASYAIAVAAAPGTAGVTPRINLNYSSNAGDGVAGIGWSIGGLSNITRCKQTLAQDGRSTAITLTANDRFCLDGQRLILTSGTYGAPGSTYRTEIDSYAVITAVNGSTGNPAYFSVQRKDGTLSDYGNGYGSQLALNGNGPILNWAISRLFLQHQQRDQ